MPIHADWMPMIDAMRKTYTKGKKRCYPISSGGKVCASAQAWSVFYAKIAKQYGRGAETNPMHSTSEAELLPDKDGYYSELERDFWVDHFTGELEQWKDDLTHWVEDW